MQVLIDSADYATSGNTAESFRVQLTNPVSARSCHLVRARMPNSFYNITSSNNTIVFNEGIGDLTATLTPGAYTTSTLKTEIETRMNAAGTQAYTWTYNGTTLLGTFSAAGAFILKWASSTAYSVLGFTASNTLSATSHTSTSVVQLNTPRDILIDIKEFSTTLITSDNGSGNFVIPVDAASGSVSDYSAAMHGAQCVDFGREMVIGTLNINVLARDGTSIDLHGGHWSMVLRFC